MFRKITEIKIWKIATFSVKSGDKIIAMAPQFYRKNGFVDCEHVIFMAKEMR